MLANSLTLPRLHLRILQFLLLLALGGCGYSLRSADAITGGLETLRLVMTDPNSALAQELIAVLPDIEIISENLQLDSKQNLSLLTIEPEQLNRRPVTVNARARAAQYELSLATVITLSRGQTLLLDSVQISVQSEYFEEIENLSGTQDEVALLTQEMRRNLVQQIIRRVAAAQP